MRHIEVKIHDMDRKDSPILSLKVILPEDEWPEAMKLRVRDVAERLVDAWEIAGKL